jgi:hypothetical protein
MNLRTMAAASALAGVGYLLGLSTATSSAQQTFLPSDFQAGATLTLNNNKDVQYSVLAQQGAWIRVQIEDRARVQSPSEKTWIYAPNGTIWTRVK